MSDPFIIQVPDCCCCIRCADLDIDPFPLTFTDIILCPCNIDQDARIDSITLNDVDYDLPFVSSGYWSAMLGNVDVVKCSDGTPIYSGPLEIEVVCTDVGDVNYYLVNVYAFGRTFILFSQILLCQNSEGDNAIVESACTASPSFALAYGGSVTLRA